MQSGLRISKPTIFLFVFLLFAQFMNGMNIARTGYSDRFTFWYALAFYWAIGWWFIHDSRNQGIQWTDHYLDIGILLYVAWIFLIPYYLFRTRGWKAIYILGSLLGAYFGAYITGALLYSLFSLF